MLVDARGTQGTIGGGRLEWQATAAARTLLGERPSVRIMDLVLGPDLGQCCGGRVELWLQRLTRADLGWLRETRHRVRAGRADPSRGLSLATRATLADGESGRTVSHRVLCTLPSAPRLRLERSGAADVTLVETLSGHRPSLWIFGAGHVGQALVKLLSQLSTFDITWIDPRAELLPPGLPEGTTLVCAAPVERVAAAPAGSHHVVLTHDHGLDYELCRAILARADLPWLGLIGSASKAARFRSRLLRAGVDSASLARLHCPIGVEGVSSKLPLGVAIAIAAQLLQLHPAGHAGAAARPPDHGGDPRDCATGCAHCSPQRSAPP